MTLLAIISLVLTGLRWIILIDVILSWVMRDPSQFPRSLTTQITDPLYAPVRAILKPERTGGLDLSPIVILLLLHAMEVMLRRGGI